MQRLRLIDKNAMFALLVGYFAFTDSVLTANTENISGNFEALSYTKLQEQVATSLHCIRENLVINGFVFIQNMLRCIHKIKSSSSNKLVQNKYGIIHAHCCQRVFLDWQTETPKHLTSYTRSPELEAERA